MSWEQRVQEVKRRYQQLTEQLADPALLNARDKFRDIAREHAELTPVVETARELERARTQLAEARAIAEGDDRELAELAEAEIAELTEREKELSDTLRRLLIPKDPLADRAA